MLYSLKALYFAYFFSFRHSLNSTLFSSFTRQIVIAHYMLHYIFCKIALNITSLLLFYLRTKQIRFYFAVYFSAVLDFVSFLHTLPCDFSIWYWLPTRSTSYAYIFLHLSICFAHVAFLVCKAAAHVCICLHLDLHALFRFATIKRTFFYWKVVKNTHKNI